MFESHDCRLLDCPHQLSSSVPALYKITAPDEMSQSGGQDLAWQGWALRHGMGTALKAAQSESPAFRRPRHSPMPGCGAESRSGEGAPSGSKWQYPKNAVPA